MFNNKNSLIIRILILLINLPLNLVFCGTCNYYTNLPPGITITDTCDAFTASIPGINIEFDSTLGRCNQTNLDNNPSIVQFEDDQCIQQSLTRNPSITDGKCNNPNTGCKLYSVDVKLYNNDDCSGEPSFIFNSIITDGAAGQCISTENNVIFNSWLFSDIINENGYSFTTYQSNDCSGDIFNEIIYENEICNLRQDITSPQTSQFVTVILIDDGSDGSDSSSDSDDDATPAPTDEEQQE